MPDRKIRYQAAIVTGHQLLLLRIIDPSTANTFWLLPGGGSEPHETAQECLRREVREETSLHVEVRRRLYVQTGVPGWPYEELHTYLCRVRSGVARPGTEPEVDTDDHRTIQEVGWFDLRYPSTWNALVTADPITHPQMQRIRQVLGYLTPNVSR